MTANARLNDQVCRSYCFKSCDNGGGCFGLLVGKFWMLVQMLVEVFEGLCVWTMPMDEL